MLGKMGDMYAKLKEAKKLADEIKNKLEQTLVEGEAASGDIKVQVNGNRKVLSVTIASAVQHGDKIFLEENIVKALNEALIKAEKLNEEEMKKAAGGILPGFS
ncbi:MAG: YbaB/EbfC family nucleoid-associated protein [Sphingobacteriaceae bacterium]|nr:YbaB/EbfC family nucleoid-associated protein [Sphingobacteriaceae bacterium]